MSSMQSTDTKRQARGLKLQRVCVCAAIAAPIAVLFFRAPMFRLFERAGELEREAWSILQPQPAGADAEGAITVATPEGAFAVDSRRAMLSMLDDNADQQEVLLKRLTWLSYAIYICWAIPALTYPPLLLSVYLSTQRVVARVWSLLIVAPVALFTTFIVDFAPESASAFDKLLLMFLLYFYLVLPVVFLVLHPLRGTAIAVPLALLAAVPMILVCAFNLQPRMPTAPMLQYGLSIVSTAAMIGCLFPYCRLCSGRLMRPNSSRTGSG